MGQRTAVVTGANSGIGLETARGLLRADHHVVLLCRDPGRAEAARADLVASVPGASVSVVLGDLGLQASVRDAAAGVAEVVDHLDVLVNNAGMITRTRSTTDEGVDVMLAVNHLGPFLLTNLLRPLLEAAPTARVVTVASHAHKFGRVRLDDLQATRGYGPLGFGRYGETKLMNVLFSRELARRLAGTGVTANALHPGAVSTNIGNPPKVLAAALRPLMRTPADGARTSLHVALDPSLAGVTGSYFRNSALADRELSAQARDDALAAELWTRSAELVGLPG